MQIDFNTTGVSNLIKDYLAENENLKPFYGYFPEQKNYLLQAKSKLANYQHRNLLVDTIRRQHKNVDLHEKQLQNIECLALHNTVTVTTGHQLNLLSGPMYFIYKILHTIKICDQLNSSQNDYNFVPVYWMATEDHDFDEINHFHTYAQNVSYNAIAGGFVGDISTNSTHESLGEFMESLGDTTFDVQLKQIIQKAYFEQENLAEATRILVHELLGEYGILILDGNDNSLKKIMIPYFEQELFNKTSQEKVQQTNKALDSYGTQAFAREINLFYLHQNIRERIENIGEKYVLSLSQKEFSKEEIRNELYQSPEKFSPNVILRPLYQEVILPNTAYVGGGGEIAYWLQLKSLFESYQVIFPMLVVRNSGLIVPNYIKHKAEKFDLMTESMFLSEDLLKNQFIQEQSELFAAMDILKTELESHFQKLNNIAQLTSPVFENMLKAQKTKQLNGFNKLNKRLIKSEKIRFDEQISKIGSVYSYLFPQKSWQERRINFSEFYRTYGAEIFHHIYHNFPAFESKFNIITPDDKNLD
ncbi:MAG: bacillithiol biosynthesis cysteine-adding enzyme BshC [Flavobacteriaceae bacterium]|nr:bacillithiol biosynthesis cysteine-adding enzyme BshC [Flavobacteriaceae bacterium]